MAKAKRPQSLEEAAEVAKMLADATRLKILSILAFDGPKSVGQVCDELKLAQPTVSHHLGLLRMTKLVEGARRGKQVIYSTHGSLTKSSAVSALKVLLAKLSK